MVFVFGFLWSRRRLEPARSRRPAKLSKYHYNYNGFRWFFLVFYGLDAGQSRRDLDDRPNCRNTITIIMVFVDFFFGFLWSRRRPEPARSRRTAKSSKYHYNYNGFRFFFLVFYGLDARPEPPRSRRPAKLSKYHYNYNGFRCFLFSWFSMVSTPAGAGEISTTGQIVEIVLQL